LLELFFYFVSFSRTFPLNFSNAICLKIVVIVEESRPHVVQPAHPHDRPDPSRRPRPALWHGLAIDPIDYRFDLCEALGRV
jgi:hypothetical protein